jgi:hypothetical protein
LFKPSVRTTTVLGAALLVEGGANRLLLPTHGKLAAEWKMLRVARTFSCLLLAAAAADTDRRAAASWAVLLGRMTASA